MPTTGNTEQIRIVAEQVADAVISKYVAEHPEASVKTEIPPPLKWAAGILAGLATVGITGFVFWMVTTLNDMQLAMRDVQTQLGTTGAVEARFGDINRRIDRLEEIHVQERRGRP